MQEEDNGNKSSTAEANAEGDKNVPAEVARTKSSSPSTRPYELFKLLAAEVKESGKPYTLTPRLLLDAFGYKRRGAVVVSSIDAWLEAAGVSTQPDYRSVWLDSEIALVPAPTSPDTTGIAHSGQQTPVPTNFDPTYRLSRLRAANNLPVSVSPQRTVKEALTVMMANDFSQLPAMSGERSVKGVISLSSIAKRSALGAKCETVQDCLEPPHVLRADTFLFDAINDIINHEYVLVQGTDGRVTGIVTTSDLSLEFRQLAEPFLLTGEIEQHIRLLLERGRFKPDELSECRDEKDTARVVSKVSDLTFGEYVRLLENPTRWQRLELQLDRAEFVKPLKIIQNIRNDIMHFDPDPFEEADLNHLRNFVVFLQKLRQILYR